MTTIRDILDSARVAASSSLEFRRLLAAGLVDSSNAWYAAKGAERFVRAIATGDIAPVGVVAERIAKCRECETRVRITIDGANSESDWCGPPLEDHETHPDPFKRSCGCLIAGKVRVGSESCPRRKWGYTP